VSRLLVATNNPGKLAEFHRLLRGLPVVSPRDVGLSIEVPEPYDSYAENAAAKADAFCRASGLLTLADDSGLEVAALGGGPGVRTGRYGGDDVDDRVGHLLEQIAGADDRRARMVCVLALAIPRDAGEPQIELFGADVVGVVARDRRGAGGFGFDPVFLLASGSTTAELDDEVKDLVSHRGRAVHAALPRIRELLRDEA
jgi:XTP/dITP diphosphohydrolase